MRRAVAVAVILPTLLSCRSAPPPRPTETSCEAEEVLKRRVVEVVPLVAASPPLEPDVLGLLRAHFARALTASGVFELTDGAERQGEFIISGVLTDYGALPAGELDSYQLDARDGDRDAWALRFVVEVRAKADNHLVAVVGATHSPDLAVVQAGEQEVERLLPNPRLRHGLLQVTSQVASALAGRFAAGAALEDPANLDLETLVVQGKALYAQGAFFDAEARLRTALERDANNAQVASLLGDIYFNRRDYVKAVDLYNTAVDVEATRFRELALLGNSYFYLMEHERAVRVWEQALQIDAKGPHAKSLRGNLRRGREAMRRGERGRGLSGRSDKKTPAAATKKDAGRRSDDEF